MKHRIFILKVMLCICVALAFFFIAYAAADAPLGDGKRMGLRGLKRQRALERNETWQSLEPLVRWLGMRISGLMTQSQKDSLNHQISIAGDFLGLLPEELVALSIITGVAGLGAGYLLGSLSGMGGILVIACGGFGAVAPSMTLSSTAADRFKDVNRRLPYAIDLLALGMGAGLDFPGAVRQVVEKSGAPDDALVEEFTLILQGLQVGRTRRQALEDFAERVPSDPVKEFVGAVVQAELRGNPVAHVLRIQAEVSRNRRSVRAEEAAAKAGVAMVAPLMMVFVCILILIVSPMIMKLQQGGM
ncbi:MAG: type II secretion system F family protein [Polyangiaceae bacterium]|jgi:tight adherence protein C